MNLHLKKSFWFLAFVAPFFANAQSNAPILSGQDTSRNPITVAVPFVGFAPDSRGAAMGDAGVASSPDAYSVHWNNAKLAFIEDDLGFSFSYSPWLGNIVDDMSLNYLTFYKKIDRVQTIGATIRYFDLGEIQLTDANAEPLGLENPREAAFDATYSRKLSENIGIGGTIRYIWSNLSGNITGAPDAKAGTSVAIDLGFYYNKELVFNGKNAELSFGAHLSNFGQKITYSNDSNEDFIPTNLRLGSGFKTNIDPYNSITLLVDFNKLLVPTPPFYQLDDDGQIQYDANGEPIILKGKDPNRPLLSGAFGSFTDAPNGFSEEMQEIMISTGLEYKYRDVFAVRAGYFHESKNKGDRKYFTAGLGFKYQVFEIDFSYLVPRDQNHPLGDTLRLSFVFSFDTKDEDPTDG
ncbi:type IX secretion system outer membrane channel protein PorV [Marinoscillum pacificum]|uniref:type IX secretion system outer membrane channel protein PorV n=1 Tax=Marinoscillum pacificum TaxID=392723 RepID=UPI0021571105|nr:type IX secretion system outer membrane channel protein PorV [Marinoscillum pacificum]